MEVRMRRFALTVALACFSPVARAQAPDYPDPQCTKPQMTTVKPNVQVDTSRGVSIDSGAVGSFNSRVKAFNRDAAAYNACMHAYIDAANRDVKTVQDKTNSELKLVAERGNASMKMIQDKIRQAVTDANSLGAELEAENARLRK
jgi:hypothetical protein